MTALCLGVYAIALGLMRYRAAPRVDPEVTLWKAVKSLPMMALGALCGAMILVDIAIG